MKTNKEQIMTKEEAKVLAKYLRDRRRHMERDVIKREAKAIALEAIK